jgi:ADP-heptose:LPS heptosyltransferase
MNRRGDWPADRWWASRGKGKTFFVAYDPTSQLPISRFFFERTLEYLKFARGDQEDLFRGCSRLTLGRDLILRALARLGLGVPAASERRLVVHPGSGGRAKRWPLRNFMEVVRRAASHGIDGVLVTGEAEADIEEELRDSALPSGWLRASCLAPETLAGLLATSTHYVGNDSGPTHLAAACGASVLAIFLDEHLPAWRPFGRTRVLSAPAVDRVSVEAVLAALDDMSAFG